MSNFIDDAAVVPPKRTRTTSPKTHLYCVIDAGRSRIKFQARTTTRTTPVMTLDSLVCPVESLPYGERGAFSMARTVDDQHNEIVEHWVVGSSARFQGKDFVTMTERADHKVAYFPVLALGAIASLPYLEEFSTGTHKSKRTLHIHLSTLSLASPRTLHSAIEQCRWIVVDGVKYRLSFSRAGCVGFPEGYGAALFTQQRLREVESATHTFYTFDIGFGTATLTEYDNLGTLPKRGMCNPHGGGGIATLLRVFAEQLSTVDAARVMRPSQIKDILETSTLDDQGGIHAYTAEGHDIGDVLSVAIRQWMKDSPLTYALETLATSGRRHPVTLCGGGFAIAPVRMLVRDYLRQAGIPNEHVLIPEDPGTIALAEMHHLFSSPPPKDSLHEARHTTDAA